VEKKMADNDWHRHEGSDHGHDAAGVDDVARLIGERVNSLTVPLLQPVNATINRHMGFGICGVVGKPYADDCTDVQPMPANIFTAMTSCFDMLFDTRNDNSRSATGMHIADAAGRYPGVSWRHSKERSSFLKKRTKKLLFLWRTFPDKTATAI
jgi:hypothetical protein